MQSIEASYYATEREERVLRAQAHTQEMFSKYYSMSGSMGRLSSSPGFECWITEGRNHIGQVTWVNEWPLPFSCLYPSYSLRSLRWLSAQLLIPYLEEGFSGDLIDRDYIEGMMTSFEELGIAHPGKIIVADDSFIPRLAGPHSTLDELNSSGPYNYAAYIECGPMMVGRIALVRQWLKRKKKQAPLNEALMPDSVETGGNDNHTSQANSYRAGNSITTNPWTNLFKEDYTVDNLTRLLVSVGLLEDEISKAPTADTEPQAWRGVIEALMRCKILDRKRSAKAIACAIAASYGQGLISVRTVQTRYSDNPRSEAYCSRALSFLRK
jgi:hypothetical protein